MYASSVVMPISSAARLSLSVVCLPDNSTLFENHVNKGTAVPVLISNMCSCICLVALPCSAQVRRAVHLTRLPRDKDVADTDGDAWPNEL